MFICIELIEVGESKILNLYVFFWIGYSLEILFFSIVGCLWMCIKWICCLVCNICFLNIWCFVYNFLLFLGKFVVVVKLVVVVVV